MNETQPVSTSIKVLLVDDHKLLRKGLRLMLEANPLFQVVGEAGSAAEVTAWFSNNALPEVVLMDISLGEDSGVTLTRKLLQTYMGLGIIGLTMSDTENDIKEMLRAGAKGYILKDCTPDELTDSIQLVAKGQTYFSPQVTEVVLRRHMRGATNRSDQHFTEGGSRFNSPIDLTTREREILRLVSQEMTTPEIADKLCLSPRTVENHRYRLMSKLKVKNALGLVKYAVQYGLAE
jgi:DNA-binding NarL/FixJ family response regulator